LSESSDVDQDAGVGTHGAGEAPAPHDPVTPAPGTLPSAPLTFGRQRPPLDVAALALLFAGFFALGVGFWILTTNWLGALLPLAFLIGAWQSLRADVREIELRPDTLVVRTFFREYGIPKAHVTEVLQVPEGIAIEVLNGNRYLVTPPGSDLAELARAFDDWLSGPRLP